MGQLMTGRDREAQIHLVMDNALKKGCGHRISLCGVEVTPESPVTDDSTTQCFHCRHAFSLGAHQTTELFKNA
jgi:hypothetical protein